MEISKGKGQRETCTYGHLCMWRIYLVLCASLDNLFQFLNSYSLYICGRWLYDYTALSYADLFIYGQILVGWGERAQRCHAGPRFHRGQPMPVSAHGAVRGLDTGAPEQKERHSLARDRRTPFQRQRINQVRSGEGEKVAFAGLYKALTRQARGARVRSLRSHEGTGRGIQSDWSALGFLGGRMSGGGGGGQEDRREELEGETPVASPSQALFLKATGEREWKAEAGEDNHSWVAPGSRVGWRGRRKPQEGRRKPVFIQVHSSFPMYFFVFGGKPEAGMSKHSRDHLHLPSSIISCNLIHVKSVACEFLSWLVKNLSRESSEEMAIITRFSRNTPETRNTQWCMWLRGHHRGSAPAGKEAEPTVVALSPPGSTGVPSSSLLTSRTPTRHCCSNWAGTKKKHIGHFWCRPLASH